MQGMSQRMHTTEMGRFPIFIGCACNSSFVEPTATMLTSLDVNGEVPEADVLVACFGLSERDRDVLRIGAGARTLRFIEITSDMLGRLDGGRFTEEYTIPVIGRLFLANYVATSNARMVTLDSDMIVMSSLRPLFFRELGDHYFAAIHDPPRVNDPTYFNSGLTMFDVDMYRHFRIAERCLTWLSEQKHHPNFPDQDALNVVVGHRYHRLARTWNYFCCDSGGFVAEDYETCKIAHFAGPKPWNHHDHPGWPVYRRHLALLHHRLQALSNDPAPVLATNLGGE